MFQIAEYWLDTVGVDGFRLDAVLYILEEGSQLQNTPSTFAFWEDYTARVKSVSPDALSVGEAWTGTSTVLQYVADGRLDMCFEFDLAYATLDAVNNADVSWLSTKAEQVYRLYPYLQYATFLTNHDQNRAFTTLGLNAGKARAAAGLYLTLPGVPFVYYGEEIGMTGSGDHLNIRTPMQWTDGEDAGFTTGTPWRAVNSDYTLRNVADEESDPGSLLEWYRRLVHARSGSPALRQGAHRALDASDSSVLAFVRACEQETVLCVVNAGPSSLNGVTLTGSAASLEPGDHTLVNLLDPGDTLSVTVTPEHEIEGLALDGHEVAVYRLDGSTGTDPGNDVGLRLEQSFPNPFTLPTTIRYTLPAQSHAHLAVYDVAGREVAVLEDGPRSAGPHEVVWDGTGSSDRPVAAGLYFVRLDAGGRTRTAKAMLVR